MGQPVAYNVVNPTSRLLSPASFLKILDFKNDHERQYVKYIAKLALADKVRIHLLIDTVNKPIAFVALSLETISSYSCLVINYLFCSTPYRTVFIEELKNKKISGYLVAQAIQIAHEITPHAPIHYIALQPAHKKLELYYANLGFTRLHHKEWMFLKI